MCALFGRVSQSENLFLRTRAGKHRRDQWISARVVATIDRSLHAHRASADETAQVFQLTRRDREAEQRRAAFDEGPSVIAPRVDPLATVPQVCVLCEGVNGAERALASEKPFEIRGIFRRENELALDVEALEIRRSLQLDDFRDHAVRRSWPAPHSERCGYRVIVRQ